MADHLRPFSDFIVFSVETCKINFYERDATAPNCVAMVFNLFVYKRNVLILLYFMKIPKFILKDQ